ncbi:recombinase family protein [bacterium]|nr:recombinase family protein [bacterium]
MSAWPQLQTLGRRIGYARVSTPDQKLNMQLDALNAVGCDEVFSDHGVSGAKANRPGLDEALDAVAAGDLFVVFKLDRLGRSVLHLADLLTRFRNEDINFCSLSEGINTATPGGKLVYHVFSAVAEFQRDMIRENTVYGLQAARRRGKQLGRPFSLDELTILEAHRLVMQDDVPISETASRCGVAHSTLTRAFKRFGLDI